MGNLQAEEIKNEDLEQLRKMQSDLGKKKIEDIPLPGLGKHKSRS